MENPIMRPKQAAEYLGMSISYFWAKTRPKNKRYDPTFPRPFKINGATGKAVGVRRQDLDNWIAQQQAQSIPMGGA